MANPETTLVWHPLKLKLDRFRESRLLHNLPPPFWHRIETHTTGSGFPDLWWTYLDMMGVLELKHRAAPPVREDTPCAIESITAHQRLFWRQAALAAARVHVLTRVGLIFYLHEGLWAAQNLGKVPVSELSAHALFAESKLPTAERFLELMR